VKPGFIAELSVPEDAESARRLLSQLVNELKEQPLFVKVDLLSPDLRRDLADPKVTGPGEHRVLALDFAQTEFQPTPLLKKPPADRPSRGTSRRAARPVRLAMLGRRGPLSADWGVDRGTPIDRVYIEAFLDHHMATTPGPTVGSGGKCQRSARPADCGVGLNGSPIVEAEHGLWWNLT
jgi:hypothetical protein